MNELLLTLALLKAADTTTTLIAVHHHGAREANPTVLVQPTNAKAFITYMGAYTVGQIYLTKKIAVKHPALAKALTMVSISSHGFAVSMNLNYIRKN
jgi:hypothetical protein